MNTGARVQAGGSNEHTFTLLEAYELYRADVEATARRAAGNPALKLTPEDQELAVARAMEECAIPEEFFEEYSGAFTVHRPTVGETIKLDNLTVRLAEQTPPHARKNRGGDLCEQVATCKVVIDAAPEWYKDPLSLRSMDVIALIHYGWSKFLDSFRF